MGEDQLFTSALGLSEAIQMVRTELMDARRTSADSELRFPIQSVTVELQVAAMRDAEGRTGFRIPVVDLEIGGTVSWQRTTTHTVRVVFGPPLSTWTVGDSTDEPDD